MGRSRTSAPKVQSSAAMATIMLQLGLDRRIRVACVVLWFVAFVLYGAMSEVLYTILSCLYPMYASFRALAHGNEKDTKKWLQYWVTFACFSMGGTALAPVFRQNQYHHLVSLAFTSWLLLPMTGALKLCIVGSSLRCFVLASLESKKLLQSPLRNWFVAMFMTNCTPSLRVVKLISKTVWRRRLQKQRWLNLEKRIARTTDEFALHVHIFSEYKQ